MNIVVITDEQFPIGMATTNRIRTLVRTLTENGARIRILCLRPQEGSGGQVVNPDPQGCVDGAEYEYPCGTTLRSDAFINRRWHRIKGIVRSIRSLRQIDQRTASDAMLMFVSRSIPLVLFYFVLSRVYHFLYVCEVAEHPVVFERKSLLFGLHDKLYLKYAFRLYDALLVITKHLEEEFGSRIRKGAHQLFVPMTVEASRFLMPPDRRPDSSRYIAYCGDLGPKDGIPILLKSFATLLKKYNDIKLYLIGDNPRPEVRIQLQEMARTLELNGNVVFTGRVLREDMPMYLCHATFLVLSRPVSVQADYGFPSKLGEYLSTGNPVVVTSVGEIPQFLEDGKSAFIAEPGDVEGFAQKMEYVLEHPDIARKVGLRGREVALANFDYCLQGKRIMDFLSRIAPRPSGRFS